MGLYTAAVVAVLVYVTYLWIKKKYSYWETRNIKGPKPIPIVGNFGKVLTFQQSVDNLLWTMYKNYSDEQVVGFYAGYKPLMLIRDPDMLKHIFIKDFNKFQDRGVKKEADDRFEDNLFSTEGETWRVLRQKLTPIFTSGKLRNMIPLVQNSVDNYINYVTSLIDDNKDHEIRSLTSKYTLDVIGSCAFGVDVGTFEDVPDNRFIETANLIFSPTKFRRTLEVLDSFIPGFAKFMSTYVKVPITNPKVRSFFIQLVSEIVKQREGKVKVRNDFMDLMIELKEQGRIEKKDSNKTMEVEIDTELMAAQAVVFYAAGFETSAATMSYLMYELAFHPEIQERIYEEVIRAAEKNNGVLSYDSIKELTYLEMCFDETLRKYPVAAQLVRKCSETCKIPDTKYTIEKGNSIMISVIGFHRDSKYYENPEDFDPERFSPQNKPNVNRFAYLPFGEGPRNCIGMRFAKVQSMLGMAGFIRKFKIEKSPKTPSVLTFDQTALTLTSNEGIWVKILKR